MAIGSVNLAENYYNKGFGSLTTSPKTPLVNSEGYHQATQVKPVKYSGNQTKIAHFPTTDEMELAQAIVDGKYGNLNIKPAQKVSPVEHKGGAFEGFKVPEYNGTGELRPVYGEDEFILNQYA